MSKLQFGAGICLSYPPYPARKLFPTVCSTGKAKGFGSQIQEGGGRKQKKGKKKSKISEKEEQRRKRESEQTELGKQGATGVAAGYAGYGMSNLDISTPSSDNKREVMDEDEKSFEQRLASLKETGTLLAKEKRVEREQDAENIYTNPPNIVDVLSSGQRVQVEQDKVSVGPGQFAIVGGSILLIAVFAITNGVGDLFFKAQPQTKQTNATAVQQLTSDERNIIQSNVNNLVTNLKGDGSDALSLRSIATAQIALGEYKKAESFLLQLADINQGDVETWSLLAQTRAALGDTKGKVTAYYNAFKADSQADIYILQELSGALVSDNRAQEAVQLVNDQISVNGEQKSSPMYNVVELKLLLGKVYSQWAGHNGDALAVFDSLIKSNPDDFRGYLAKGVLLRNLQNKSDAERMFLQAKFFAPRSKKSLVDQVVQQR